MSIVDTETDPIYAPLFDTFAGRVSDEPVDRYRSDPISWSNAMRRTTDLVGSDVIVISGIEAVLQDLAHYRDSSISDATFEDDVGEAISTYAETVEILADVRSEPVLCRLPSPITIILDVFGDDWLAAVTEDELTALDTLYRASQFLTELVRLLGKDVNGLVLEDLELARLVETELSLDDVLLEYGPLINIADHYGVDVIERVDNEMTHELESLSNEFDAVVLVSLGQAEFAQCAESTSYFGGSFSKQLWETTDEEFVDGIDSYLGAIPDDITFLFMPDIPADVEPEKVQMLKQQLTHT